MKVTNTSSVDFWTSLATQLTSILNEDARLTINSLSGTINVTDSHQNVERVSRFLASVNNLVLKQVDLEVQIYEGAFSDSTLNRCILYSIERHRLQRTIRQLAVIDELTGLYNRRGFNSLKSDVLQRARESNHRGYLCYFDLNEFKQINDHFGHASGDEALTEFAVLLRRVFRKETMLVRIGGDEFLAMGIEARPGLLDENIQLLHALLEEQNKERKGSYQIETSVGLTTFGRETTLDMDQGLVMADKALYLDKRKRLTNPDHANIRNFQRKVSA
jgi:diguanylate cyclase (GGDEF)-like protein